MSKQRLVVLSLLCAGLLAAPLLLTQPTSAPVTAQGPSEFPGEPLPTERGAIHAGSGVCTACHTAMTDEAGNDVSLDAAWRSTMMANAARDPYWQATVRMEAENLPELSAVIEDKCATCHMPLARSTAHLLDDAPGLMFDDGFVDPKNPLHTLAMDGNSCTLCHQIEDEYLGEEQSFSGGYVIDPDYAAGTRPSFSRFEVAENWAAIMQSASGYVPVASDHTSKAVLCASCHTLYTPYVDDNGAIIGTFPEQMPYFEWLHGGFSSVQPCQGCHMPRAMGSVVTSITGGDPVDLFYQHNFVGGNVYMQEIFMAYGAEMGVTASYDDFAATHGRLLEQLQERTAILTIPDVQVINNQLDAQVRVQVLTGHKFPAGFPSRRAFLHVTVLDANGAVVFESGAYEDTGVIIGDDHDADPLRYEPHYTVISSPEQVQIYESVIMDYNGMPTTTLLRGAGLIKNNRLLPKGFNKMTAWDDIAVQGTAVNDPDFLGGEDRVRYVIDLGDAEGPFTMRAELLYLSIGYHWAEKLRDQDSAEAVQFMGYYDTVPNLPVTIAWAATEIE